MEAAHAEEVLGVGRSAVNRYIGADLLTAEKVGKGWDIDSSSVYVLNRRKKAFSELEGRLEELFVLKAGKVSWQDIKQEYGLCKNQGNNALWFYNWKRRGRFADLDVTDGNVFTTKEVTSRLKIKARHVLRELRDNDVLKCHETGENGNTRYFVDQGSFMGYLGDRANRILYNSREVRTQIGIDVKTIDEIALEKGLGMKLKPHDPKKSMYLFTANEIDVIRQH